MSNNDEELTGGRSIFSGGVTSAWRGAGVEPSNEEGRTPETPHTPKPAGVPKPEYRGISPETHARRPAVLRAVKEINLALGGAPISSQARRDIVAALQVVWNDGYAAGADTADPPETHTPSRGTGLDLIADLLFRVGVDYGNMFGVLTREMYERKLDEGREMCRRFLRQWDKDQSLRYFEFLACMAGNARAAEDGEDGASESLSCGREEV